MASMAVDVLDQSWRILQGEEKPLTLRGRRRLRSKKRGAKPKKLGSKYAALEQMLRRIDIRRAPEQMLQHLQFADDNDKPTPAETAIVGYSQNAYQWEKERFREEEEEIELLAISNGAKERSRAMKLISCPGYFEEEVVRLEVDPEIGSLTTAILVEDLEREALQGLATP